MSYANQELCYRNFKERPLFVIYNFILISFFLATISTKNIFFFNCTIKLSAFCCYVTITWVSGFTYQILFIRSRYWTGVIKSILKNLIKKNYFGPNQWCYIIILCLIKHHIHSSWFFLFSFTIIQWYGSKSISCLVI